MCVLCVCVHDWNIAHKQSHYMLGTSHATKYCTSIMTMVSTWSPRSARPEQQGAKGEVWSFIDGVYRWLEGYVIIYQCQSKSGRMLASPMFAPGCIQHQPQALAKECAGSSLGCWWKMHEANVWLKLQHATEGVHFPYGTWSGFCFQLVSQAKKPQRISATLFTSTWQPFSQAPVSSYHFQW